MYIVCAIHTVYFWIQKLAQMYMYMESRGVRLRVMNYS